MSEVKNRKDDYMYIAPNKNDTYKTIRLQEGRSVLGAKELDVFDILMSNLKYGDKKQKKLIVKMNIDDYKEFYITSDNIYRDFKKSCKKLQGAGIYVEDEFNNKEKWYSLFSTIEYLNSKAKIIVTFTEEIKEILFEEDIKKIWYNLKYSIRLSNSYSKKRYYHVKGFCYGRHVREDNADELMNKLNIPKSYYENFRKFEKHILKKSDEDINRFTDLIINTEVDKSMKPYRIRTYIRKKTVEELQETEKLFNSLKIQAPKEMNSDSEECLYDRIEKRLKLYPNITVDVKKTLAEELDVSGKTLNMYISIINGLSEDFKVLFRKSFLSVVDSYKYSKLDSEKQHDAYKILNKEIEKIKKKLCKELADKLGTFEITLLQAKKYCTYDYNKQYELYERRFVEKKPKVIDVEYKELKKKQVNEENNKDHIENSIKEVREILKNIQLTDEQAQLIFSNAAGDLGQIKYIYEEAQKQRNNIESIIGWIRTMVIPGKYIAPVRKESDYINPRAFNNFKGREYDYDNLEAKLLGWDKEENNNEIIQEGFDIYEKIGNGSEVVSLTKEVKEKLQLLNSIIGEVKYKCWIDSGIISASKENEIMIIECLNKFTVDSIKKNYDVYISEIVKEAYPEVEKIEYKTSE